MIEEKRRQAVITIDADLPPDLPDFNGDKRAMIQVLLNLLSNAVKFTPTGGTITIRANTDGDGGISLTVADTGVGIPPEDLSTLMQPSRRPQKRHRPRPLPRQAPRRTAGRRLRHFQRRRQRLHRHD
jgi:signal transduction histidine kinase